MLINQSWSAVKEDATQVRRMGAVVPSIRGPCSPFWGEELRGYEQTYGVGRTGGADGWATPCLGPWKTSHLVKLRAKSFPFNTRLSVKRGFYLPVFFIMLCFEVRYFKALEQELRNGE